MQLCHCYFLLTLFSQVSLNLFLFCNFLQLKCFLLECFFHFMSLFSHTYHSFTGFPLLLLLLPAAAVAEVAAVGPVFNSGLVRVPPWPVKLIHLNVNRKSQLTTLLDLSTVQPTFSWIKIKKIIDWMLPVWKPWLASTLGLSASVSIRSFARSILLRTTYRRKKF